MSAVCKVFVRGEISHTEFRVGVRRWCLYYLLNVDEFIGVCHLFSDKNHGIVSILHQRFQTIWMLVGAPELGAVRTDQELIICVLADCKLDCDDP